MARDRGICVRAVGTYPCQRIPISNAHVPVARNVNHHAASSFLLRGCYRPGADRVLPPLFAQRALAAVLAICFRSSDVSFLARALEPFLPMAAKYSLTSGLGFFMRTRIMLDG
jgi:hypothetical protein